MTQILVGHHREQGPAVMTDAFADGAGQLIVSPIACTGFRIGRDVRGHDAARKIVEPHHLANAFAARQHRAAMGIPVVQRMASGASGGSGEKIVAALQPLRQFVRTGGK